MALARAGRRVRASTGAGVRAPRILVREGLRVLEPGDPHGSAGTIIGTADGWAVAWDEYTTGAFQLRPSLADELKDGRLVLLPRGRK